MRQEPQHDQEVPGNEGGGVGFLVVFGASLQTLVAACIRVEEWGEYDQFTSSSIYSDFTVLFLKFGKSTLNFGGGKKIKRKDMGIG